MEGKRVELSIHTNMSELDSVNDVEEYINAAIEDRQPAIAVTDIDSVQALPDAYRFIRKTDGIKLIYGCELHYAARYPFYVLAKNKNGLKELYELISNAYDNVTDAGPTVLLDKVNRKNLILGTSIMGELIENIVCGADDIKLEGIIKQFDYVLLNPTEYFSWYTKGEIKDVIQAEEITKRIISFCEKNSVLPIASDEAHFVFSDDGECRKILLDYKGAENCDKQPNLYLRTTDEMLSEFAYLGKEKAYEVVVTNSNLIADMTEGSFEPFDEETVYPNKSNELRAITYDAAYTKYGTPLPNVIKERIETELNAICTNSKNVMKLILAEGVAKYARDHGYFFSPRGSLGSLLIVNLLGISNISPLNAHYFCEKCKYIEFHTEENCGVDLPDKKCPKCGEPFKKDGFNSPEEICIGYEPCREISLEFNLSPELFNKSHNVMRKKAKGKVTDSGVIDLLPYESGYYITDNYAQKRKLKFCDNRKIEYAKKLHCCKWKLLSHQCGVFVLPENKKITDYTPVQYSPDFPKRKITHFDYNDLSGLLLTMIFVKNDMFSMIHKLESATGIKSNHIPLNDEKTMELIRKGDTDGIYLFRDEIGKDLIKIIKPKKFDDLIKIFGFSSGTGLWDNNGESLLNTGFDFSNLIAFRDDVMLALMKYGIGREKAFKISEDIRKGKGIGNELYNELLELNVPKWLLNSCRKIEYAFPKAHTVECVRNSFILAYYKTHYRAEFERVQKEIQPSEE